MVPHVGLLSTRTRNAAVFFSRDLAPLTVVFWEVFCLTEIADRFFRAYIVLADASVLRADVWN